MKKSFPWTQKQVFCYCCCGFSVIVITVYMVIIQFTARSTYLLQVPQGRVPIQNQRDVVTSYIFKRKITVIYYDPVYNYPNNSQPLKVLAIASFKTLLALLQFFLWNKISRIKLLIKMLKIIYRKTVNCSTVDHGTQFSQMPYIVIQNI